MLWQIRLSVTLWYCVKTSECRGMQSSFLHGWFHWVNGLRPVYRWKFWYALITVIIVLMISCCNYSMMHQWLWAVFMLLQFVILMFLWNIKWLLLDCIWTKLTHPRYAITNPCIYKILRGKKFWLENCICIGDEDSLLLLTNLSSFLLFHFLTSYLPWKQVWSHCFYRASICEGGLGLSLIHIWRCRR